MLGIVLIPIKMLNGSSLFEAQDRSASRLQKIADLLDLWNNKNRHSADVKQLALSHIEKLEIRITELQKMTNTLQNLINCCAGDHRPNCPILEGLQKQDIELQESYHQNDSLSVSPLAQQKVK